MKQNSTTGTVWIVVLALAAASCGGSEPAATTAPAEPSTTVPPPEASSLPTTVPPPHTTSSPTTSTIPATSAAATHVLVGPSGPGDWPGYTVDAVNSMHNATETLLGSDNVADLAVKWRFDAPGGVTGTPAVVAGVVYFGDWDGYARAVSAEDGSVIWEKKVTDGQITASLYVTEDSVYVPVFDARLVSLDRVTGETNWSVSLDDQEGVKIFSSPIVADGLVIIGIGQARSGDRRLGVVAVDVGDGSERWRMYTDTGDGTSGWSVAVWSTAAVDVDRRMVFIGSGNTNWRGSDSDLPDSPFANAILALDLDTGEVVWIYRLVEDDRANLDVGAAPNLFTLAGRDVVGVGGKSGHYVVVDRDTGEPIWQVKLTDGGGIGGVQGAAAVHDGMIYVASNDRGRDAIVLALDAADGSIVWQTRLSSPTVTAVALANGVVYATTSGVGNSKGSAVQALDASNGTVLWRAEHEANVGGAPSISNGVLYVGSGFVDPRVQRRARDGALTAYWLAGSG